MKKFAFCILTLFALLFAACAEASIDGAQSADGESPDNSESQASVDGASLAGEPSSAASSEGASEYASEYASVDSSSDAPDVSESSDGSDASESSDGSDASALTSEPSVESSAQAPVGGQTYTDTARITAEIASHGGAGFETNAPGCEALDRLKAYLEDTDYGFFYCDLDYNAYVAYGCDKLFKTASTAKLPYIKYLCTLADGGEIDLNERLLFEERHRDSGSGFIKSLPSGQEFSVRTLMDYALRYSDNIAYTMLLERFGFDGYFESVRALGVSYTTAANGYTSCTASTMAALLFDVGRYGGANLSLMLDAGCNASYNYQIGAELSEYKVLQKYGAIKPGNVAYHDIAVVYAPHPYILLIYTTVDYDSAGKNVPFRELARLTENLNQALYGD